VARHVAANHAAGELLDRSGAALDRVTREVETLTKVTRFCAAGIPVEAWGAMQ
jgi:hypothetical protein